VQKGTRRVRCHSASQADTDVGLGPFAVLVGVLLSDELPGLVRALQLHLGWTRDDNRVVVAGRQIYLCFARRFGVCHNTGTITHQRPDSAPLRLDQVARQHGGPSERQWSVGHGQHVVARVDARSVGVVEEAGALGELGECYA